MRLTCWVVTFLATDDGELMFAYLEHLGVRVSGGSGWRKVQCPFHKDSVASASASAVAFNCHGCGVSEDTIKLIREQEGVDYRGAIDFIEGVLGRTVDPSNHDGGSKQVPGRSRYYRSGKKYVPARRRSTRRPD